MSYSIEIAAVVYDELAAIKAFYRRRIVDTINEQLTYESLTATKNCKMLGGIRPGFAHEAPVWELRVGQYRVYYDVDEESRIVSVRAVRHKPPHTTTEQIL